MPKIDRLHRVVAVVHAPQSTFELSCAAEVFGIERPGVPNRYSFDVCTSQPGPVRTLAGYEINVPHGLAALRRADTVVVAGWPRRDERPPDSLLRALRSAAARGCRLVGLCSGSFVLAATGLLDGRRATTHWRMAEQLARGYPAIVVEPEVLFVDHGDVATSAGTGAAIDLCLRLVSNDFGAAYAADIARHMVVPPRRSGGQLQYARRPVSPSPRTLADVTGWALARLGEPLTVDDLAGRLGMSGRSLTRRFEFELGVSPGRWLLRQRIAEACTLLERTDLTVDAVARRVGLSSATNLRRRFLAELGTTPGAYRRTFAAGHPEA